MTTSTTTHRPIGSQLGRVAARLTRWLIGSVGSGAAVVACLGLFPMPGLANPPASPSTSEPRIEGGGPRTEGGDADRSDTPEAVLTDSTREQISRAIAELGSQEFAARERATEQLMAIGVAAVPSLQELADHSDPEVRLRARDLVRQLTEGDFQARVAAFLAGEDVAFEGWEHFQQRLGSSTVMRELFIELTQTHPALVKALGGTPRDRAVAMDATLVAVQQTMFVERRMPAPVDAVALLLFASDPELELSAPYENMVLTVLRTEAGSKIQRDAPMHAPVLALIGDWVKRSTLGNRAEVIWFSISWDIPEVLPLSLQTLEGTKDSDVLSTAMQAIARFGSRQHAPAVAKLLDDSRPASEGGFAMGPRGQPLIGDVAMATIAALYDVSLEEVGFVGATEHPTYGFSIEELGFPTDDPAPRARARAKIDALLGASIPKS